VYFSVADPRGRKIICSAETWNNHIVANHPSMDGREDAIIATISNPELGFIYQDKFYPNRHIYYRRQSRGRAYWKAVVEFDDEDESDGRVVTAFPCDSKKSGELMIWPKSKD
jgi:hypothetical protein